VHAIRGALSRFFAESGFFLAAGLAFFFLVCLIPITLLGVSTLGFVLSREEAAHEVVGQLTRNFPVHRPEVSKVLLAVVRTRAASGVLGTVILIFFSTPLFGASRLILHRMMGVRKHGHYVKNVVLDSALVLILTVLLFAASSVTWLFQWMQAVILYPALASRQGIYLTTIGFSIAVSTVMFLLAYRYLPLDRPRASAALKGALLAALLWEAAKQGFRLYIHNFGVYDRIYGPFGVLIAFAMFAYYSAVVYTFGAAYVAALDARPR